LDLGPRPRFRGKPAEAGGPILGPGGYNLAGHGEQGGKAKQTGDF